jgi:hypothetical protein
MNWFWPNNLETSLAMPKLTVHVLRYTLEACEGSFFISIDEVEERDCLARLRMLEYQPVFQFVSLPWRIFGRREATQQGGGLLRDSLHHLASFLSPLNRPRLSACQSIGA